MHFVMMGVSATGRKWLGSDWRGFGGIGATVEVFRRSGTLAVLCESNKTEWKTGRSSVAQSFSTLAGMPFGPGALPILHLASCGCTPS